jgi:hypothetical protein
LAVEALFGANASEPRLQPNRGRITRWPYWVPKMIRIDSSTLSVPADTLMPATPSWTGNAIPLP